MWRFDIRIYCEMITTVSLATPIYHLCIYLFLFILCVGGTFKISFSDIRLFNTVLLTIVTVMFIRSSERIHLVSGTLYPLTVFTHFPPLITHPWNHQSLLWVWFILDSTYKWDHISDLFLLAYTLKIHPC